jgi:hypothetical protein
MVSRFRRVGRVAIVASTRLRKRLRNPTLL